MLYVEAYCLACILLGGDGHIEDVPLVLEPRTVEEMIVTEKRSIDEKDQECLLSCDTNNDMCLISAGEAFEVFGECETAKEECYISCPWDEKVDHQLGVEPRSSGPKPEVLPLDD